MRSLPDTFVLSARGAYLVAIIGGAALWLIATAVSGRREAWDASIYWVAAYPMAVVLAAALGASSPERAWRWGLTIMLAQGFTLAVTAGDFSLLPLGLIVFAVLSLPLIAVALTAAAIRVRRRDSPKA